MFQVSHLEAAIDMVMSSSGATLWEYDNLESNHTEVISTFLSSLKMRHFDQVIIFTNVSTGKEILEEVWLSFY